jgi:Ig-like domain from next to BRCA1 gene
MKSKSSRALQIFLASVLLLISCDVSTFAASQQIPTPVPGAINLMVAQTAGAAATQTAAQIPPTLTATIAPLPTLVPTNTPTATPTFVFVVFTPTALGGTRGYSCSYISQNPKDGTNMNGKTAFTGKWKVINDGGIAWDPNLVDFVFVSGRNFAVVSEVKIPTTVDIGSQVTISVDMTAPNKSGTYTTVWSLRAGIKSFCSLSMKIKVN